MKSIVCTTRSKTGTKDYDGVSVRFIASAAYCYSIGQSLIESKEEGVFGGDDLRDQDAVYVHGIASSSRSISSWSVMASTSSSPRRLALSDDGGLVKDTVVNRRSGSGEGWQG